MYQVGTVLSKPFIFPIRHKGLALGNGYVLENAPGYGERVVSESEFCSNTSVKAIYPGDIELASFWERVNHVLANPRQYDVFRSNCEHTVNWVLTGIAKSPQLAAGAIAGITVLSLWVYKKTR